MLEARIRTQEWTSVSYRNCKMFCSRPRTRVSPFTGTAAPFLCGSSPPLLQHRGKVLPQ